ncbi:hypothetical protein SynPROS71_00278 [Synechococcus sp. PROS-7-1]|nr:hypothetical protein SynPROS71_00278 [Synechococcus sp. PROS-7-1]
MINKDRNSNVAISNVDPRKLSKQLFAALQHFFYNDCDS